MRYDPIVLQKLSISLGVVRNTLEKVIRLAEIVRFINSNDILKDKLALKGGTAIHILLRKNKKPNLKCYFQYKNVMIKKVENNK